jgi:hypothetical protein
MAALQPTNYSAMPLRLSTMQRKPKRLTMTINFATFEKLQATADEQGRSLSNLCAYYLEMATSG